MMVEDDVLRVLGDELRSARKQRDLTRHQLNRRLPSDISLQTLATYELGTRNISVLRFIEVCDALSVSPADLLAKVCDRINRGPHQQNITVNLFVVARTDNPRLAPFRSWAKQMVAAGKYAVRLEFAALERLAELCDMEPVQLITALHEIGPNANG